MASRAAKWDVSDVLRDHYGTLVDARTGRIRPADFLWMGGLPLGLALLVVGLDVRLTAASQLLGGVGVFTGILFSVLMQTFGLAQRLVDDPRLAGQRQIAQLVDELEANVSYAVLVGLASVTALMLLTVLGAEGADGLSMGALAAALLGHLMFTALMALKRTRAVYAFIRGK